MNFIIKKRQLGFWARDTRMEENDKANAVQTMIAIWNPNKIPKENGAAKEMCNAIFQVLIT